MKDTDDSLFTRLEALGREFAAITNDTQTDRANRMFAVSDTPVTYLRMIFGDAPLDGRITILPIGDRRKDLVGLRQWFTNVTAAAAYVGKTALAAATTEANADTTHLSTTVATFQGKPGARRVDIPDHQPVEQWDAKRESMTAVYAAIAELDGKPGVSPLESLRLLLGTGLRPTMLVASGGVWINGDKIAPKLHCYFCLGAPATGKDIARVNVINKRLAAYVGADKAFAWEGHNIRVPGQLHRKGAARLAQIIYCSGPRYTLEAIEGTLDMVAPNTKPEEKAKRKTASEKCKTWQDYRERILLGDDTHDAVYGYACSLAYVGHDADTIVAMILDTLNQRGTTHPYTESEIARIVRDAVTKVEGSESFGNAEETRRKVAILRAKPGDDVWKAHKVEMLARVDALTPDSVANGLDTLAELFSEIALLRPLDGLAFWVERIRTKLGKAVNGWAKDIRKRLEVAAYRALGLLKRQNETTAETEAVYTDPRPWIDAEDADEIMEQVWAAVATYNKADPRVFRAPGGLARVVEDQDGYPIIEAFDHGKLSNEMRRVARWPFENDDGEMVNKFPDLKPLEDVLNDPKPPTPKLRGVITTPRVAKDGSIDTVPGYTTTLEMIYRPADGFVMSPVSETSSAEEVAKAVSLIDDLLEGFCFNDVTADAQKHPDDAQKLTPRARRKLYGVASRANAIACLLTSFCKPLMTGSVPLFIFNKTQPRTGATKLANTISLITLGVAMRAQPIPQNDEEFRKQITSWVDACLQLVVMDNVNDVLASGALAAALTTAKWQDRMLGTNRLVTGPIDWVWIATGNNVITSSEIADRSVMIRMKAGVADPELRDDFACDNLEAWVEDHRPELVWSCLTLVKNWLAKGAPKNKRLKFGGAFDDWAQALDGILRCAGIEGFLGNRRDHKGRGLDNEKATLIHLLTVWLDTFGTHPVRVGDPREPILRPGLMPAPGGKCGGILRLMQDNGIDIDGVELGAPASARATMGKRLLRYEGNVVDLEQRRRVGMRVTGPVYEVRTASVELAQIEDKHTKTTAWCLVERQAGKWTPEVADNTDA